jgi:hypothetical protein
MMKRRGIETRDINEAFKQEIHLYKSFGREYKYGEVNYLYLSLYNSVIDRWRIAFGDDNVLIVSQNQLSRAPRESYDLICKFIGLNAGCCIPDLFKKYHQSGRVRYPSLSKAYELLKLMIPFRPSVLAGIGYWFEQWNIEPEVADFQLEPDIVSSLTELFSKENEGLLYD